MDFVRFSSSFFVCVVFHMGLWCVLFISCIACFFKLYYTSPSVYMSRTPFLRRFFGYIIEVNTQIFRPMHIHLRVHSSGWRVHILYEIHIHFRFLPAFTKFLSFRYSLDNDGKKIDHLLLPSGYFYHHLPHTHTHTHFGLSKHKTLPTIALLLPSAQLSLRYGSGWNFSSSATIAIL